MGLNCPGVYVTASCYAVYLLWRLCAQGDDSIMSADGTNVKGKAAIAGLLATKVRHARCRLNEQSLYIPAFELLLPLVCSSLVDPLLFVTLQMMHCQVKLPAALLCSPLAS